MRFKRLSIYHFLSAEEMHLTFPQVGGITIINGINKDIISESSNGAGKSIIIEAILFALYGLTLRKAKKNSNLINTMKGKEARIELEFDDCLVIRTLSGSKMGLKLFIDGKDETVSSSIEKTKEKLADYIKIDFSTMVNILIFGQHNIFSFIVASEEQKRNTVEELMNLKEFNSYEAEAKEVLKNLKSKIEIAEQTNSIIKADYLDKKRALDDNQAKFDAYRASIDKEITGLQTQLSLVPNVDEINKQWTKYNADKAKAEELEKQILAMRNQVANIEKAINGLNKDKNATLVDIDARASEKAQSINVSLDALKVESNKLYKHISDVESKKKSCLLNKQNLKRECEIAKTAIMHSRNWDAELAHIVKQANEIKATIEDIKSDKLEANAVCPTCFGKINLQNAQKVIADYEIQLVEKRKEWAKLNAGKTKELDIMEAQRVSLDANYSDKVAYVDREIVALDLDIDDLKAALKDVDGKIIIVKAELTTLSSNAKQEKTEVEGKFKPLLEKHNKELVNINNSIDLQTWEVNSTLPQKPSITIEQALALNNQKELIASQIKQKQDALDSNPYVDIISSLDIAAKETEAKYKVSSEQVMKYQADLPYYQTVLAIFGKEGIKKFAIERIIPSLNEEINKWLQFVYDGNISIEFDSTLTPSITNIASKRNMEFTLSSGGEVRRIDIAIMLAFREVMKISTGKHPSIMFFDEVAENLDYYGVKKVYSTIQEISKDTHVFVITHNSHLMEMLNQAPTITVIKEKGLSRVA